MCLLMETWLDRMMNMNRLDELATIQHLETVLAISDPELIDLASRMPEITDQNPSQQTLDATRLMAMRLLYPTTEVSPGNLHEEVMRLLAEFCYHYNAYGRNNA